MGVYNPHIPYILGQEWVPIRPETTVFSPAVNVVELGHSFTSTAPRRLQDARFYVRSMPPLTDRGQTYLAAVYRKGTEGLSGPVQRALIPVNAVTLTNATVSGTTDAIAALLTQSTSTGISLATNVANSGVIVNFATNQFAAQLSGKRILGVNVLIGGSGTSDIFGAGSASASAIFMAQNLSVVPAAPYALFGRFGDNMVITRHKLGEINQFWHSSSVPTTPNNSPLRMPWTYTQLTRLDNLAGVLWTLITTGTSVNLGTTSASSAYIFYVALEVFYCEEQRLAVGGMQFGTTFSGVSTGTDTILGTNIIPIVDMPLYQTDTGGTTFNAVLPAGEYTVVLSSADVGALNDNLVATTSDFASLNALRELYPMPNQPGVQVDIPFPMDDTAVGETFVAGQTHILPQLSVHTSGGPLTEVHAYGTQVVAQVYGAFTAAQDIYDVGLTSSTYPQVRFYARRFGDTTVPLTLSSPSISGAGMNVSITPAQWDALQPIIDGWKEVTLRFPTAPTMGTGTNPQWIWSSTTELKGNRWEVMGAAALALSGTSGNINSLAPYPGQLYNATYGQPTAGAAINMSWNPGTQSDQGLQPAYASIRDTFTRVTASGWGTADTGQVWTVQTGTASEFSTTGSDARHVHPTTGTYDATVLAIVPQADIDYRITDDTTLTAAPLTQDFISWHDVRYIDASNQYAALVTRTIANTITLTLRKSVAGVTTVIAGPTVIPGVVPANAIAIRFRVVGNTLKAKAWLGTAATSEPIAWLLTVFDASLPGAGAVRVVSQINSGNTNTLPQSNVFDNLSIETPTDDYSADAALMFSQDSAAVSGFGITQQNQTLLGIGLNCGIAPQYVPTALAYNQLAWGLDPVNQMTDVFSRVVTSGWGTSTGGQTWATAGGSATDFSVNGSVGKVLLSTTGTYRIARLASFSARDVNAYAEIWSDTAATTLDHWGALALRDNGAGDQLYGMINFPADGTAKLIMSTVVGGSHTQLGNVVFAGRYVPGTRVKLRMQLFGSSFKGKAWLDGDPEPDHWLLELVTLTNPNAGTVVTRSVSGAGAMTISYDNITVSNYDLGYTEIQRMDTVDTTWKTIMKATNQGLITFNDYEARVAIPTSYRIRKVNILEFAGPWANGLSAASNANLVPNSFFETNVATWTAAGGATATRSTLLSHEGSASMLITPDGIGTPSVASDDFSVIAGQSYTLAGWIASASGTIGRDLNVVWKNAAHGTISINTISQTTGAINAWSQWGPTPFTAPVGAVFASVTTAATFVASSTWYVDEVTLTGPSTGATSSTIPAPGVTATSVGANDHVWIFTTNSVQSGASNLAYCLGWEGEVHESFNFPEAAGQTFQTMYGRDYVTAFRPTERGGTNFSRNLLVQAAAISPETLEDFTSLRNMAWVNVPYICLRDEDGNRWFANVSVPNGDVQRDRRLYMAPVAIVEVTDTPTPVDP